MTGAELDAMIAEAAGSNPFVKGYSMGPEPKHFIVGDICTQRDAMLGKPFTGQLGELLATIFETLKCEPRDCYITHFVKANIDPANLNEDILREVWLPIIQREYALSGCKQIVAVGKMAKMYAGHMNITPPNLPGPYMPSLSERMARAWEAFRS